MDQIMNLLETALCLSLIGLLAGLSVFGYQSMIIRTRVHADAQLVYTALNHARKQAGSVTCSPIECILGEKTFKLSGLNQVETHMFPSNAQGEFVFTEQGLTAFHNGTITIAPPEHPELAKSVVVSLGGRITLR
jgi:hypothetical protein